MSNATRKIKTREEIRKEKELDEARKRGTIPAEVDEEGRDINPHIPQYIKDAPWYYKTDKPTLRHQRVQDDKKQKVDDIHKTLRKGIIRGKTATRYRKGACQNCGSLSHTKKECVYRPRRVGARFTGQDIAPDEYIPSDSAVTFDGKRDRWASYDVRHHQKVIDEFEKVEREKRRLQAEKLRNEAEEKKKAREANAGEGGGDSSSSSDDDDDDDDDEDDEKDELKYADSAEMAGSKVDTKRRITVRNLRIREDTAKYLLNLDPNSAHYDPKTRSMRANPLAHLGVPEKDLPYAGDNFVRYSGDVPKVAEKQVFAWDAANKGAELHLQADPTKAELMHKQFKVKKANFQEDQRKSILEKYGGETHLKAPPKELLMAQTEHYVEYSQTGRVIKGKEKPKVLSRYEEDVYPGNHKSIWGSYWVDGKWGYACCHSTERNSYCTGEAGRRARKAKPTDLLAAKMDAGEKVGGSGSGDTTTATTTTTASDETESKSLVDLHQERQRRDGGDEADGSSSSSSKDKKKKKKKKHKKKRSKDSDDDDDLDDEMAAARKKEKRIQELIDKQKRADEANTRYLQMDERDRPFNSAREDYKEVTEEEMEAYRRGRQRTEDPMAHFLSK
ncbi:pre-mRNA-splicing factor SLU7 [Salpingoeca rosetta]|uniref:Pre-mRNA-splicing factor SLU7 n=1 Tax=Salpingoeca rosetta (strain ATCC 50818 / BSB-021) TaxID=946362 RepID=F2UME0_SALR5|nr:pre-mRNA-splicing factor SLU7 [Salpingoeca rosetta]EGD78289.1 pre-mRNA-splicing factor SLU7 [Salpingoeca rosetta]|eukprot:XP_004989612.1 pre-mRNA-splicing factor SLU7 [Salpingoeca rosetta]